MRQCHQRHPIRSSATQHPCLHGVGQGLEDAYADLLREPLPENWERLAARLVECADVPGNDKEN
ncbi:hypothetical protein [uncultured Methylobacterium sp.]|uniref:hypothetical protein n=1 Tax=uncultured Methylobacterium sp. TaxID=157278 RepID=UPI002595E311|nr:hypothetical protein [uncultured Methylobacterium sp.]